MAPPTLVGVNDALAHELEVMTDRRIAAHGGRFLRIRPLIVGPVVLLQLALFIGERGWSSQGLAMVLWFAVVMTAFGTERYLAKRGVISRRWLLVSLMMTTAAITVACVLTGGVGSPGRVLLFAPMAIGVGLFPSRQARAGFLLCFGLAWVGISVLPQLSAFPPPSLPLQQRGQLGAALASAALIAAGIGGPNPASEAARQVLRLRQQSLGLMREKHRDLLTASATVAHEIKNPLAAMSGLLQLIEKKPEHPNTPKRLGVVRGQLDRVLELADGYLNHAKGLRAPQQSRWPADAFVTEVAELFSARSGKADMQIHAKADATEVVGDRAQLLQATVNLLENAMVHAAPATNGVELKLIANKDWFELSVQDGGPGLPTSVLGAVGEAFVPAGGSGNGLGLAIVAAIAANHEGNMTAENPPTGGARITLRWPTPHALQRGEKSHE